MESYLKMTYIHPSFEGKLMWLPEIGHNLIGIPGQVLCNWFFSVVLEVKIEK